MKTKKKAKLRDRATVEINMDVFDELKKECKKKGVKLYAYVSNAVNNQLSNDAECEPDGN